MNRLVVIITFILLLTGCSNAKVSETDYEINYVCDDGYVLTSDYQCEKITYLEPIINYSCPPEYSLFNDVCQFEDLKIIEIKDVECDAGYEYISSANYCKSEKRVDAYYEYKCPFATFEYDGYCWQYFGDDAIYINDPHIVCIHGTLTSAGIIKSSSKCNYYYRSEKIELGPYCPSGYGYDSSIITTHNACRSTDWKKVNVVLECPFGYVQKDDYTCSKLLQVPAYKNYSCDYDYQLENEKCVNVQYENAQIVYVCPNGYYFDNYKQKCIEK